MVDLSLKTSRSDCAISYSNSFMPTGSSPCLSLCQFLIPYSQLIMQQTPVVKFQTDRENLQMSANFPWFSLSIIASQHDQVGCCNIITGVESR